MTTDHLGIDVHKTDAQVAVTDEGELLEEIRVANADLDEVAQKYAGNGNTTPNLGQGQIRTL